jgi:putative acetyltransferase
VQTEIRTAGPEDLAALQAVFRESSLSNSGDREALLANPEYLVLAPEPLYAGCTRVAQTADREIVGFATVERCGGVAELIDLFVDPGRMRRGVGRALVIDAVTSLAEDGISELQVTANEHALAFYISVGFEVLEPVATPLGSGIRMRLWCQGSTNDP